jgi:membrane protease YdiL (CAAX protease family)
MRPILSLLVYFVAVFLGGALLAPWLYWFAQWAAGHWPPLAGLAANPFHRFLGRSLLGLALLGLWPLLRSAGMAGWRELGFVKQKHPWAGLLRGFVVGWVSLACVVLLALVCGARVFVPSPSAAQLGRSLLNAALAAVIVAVLEEMMFRGALFGLLRRAMPWPAALAVSSAIYSLAHFMAKAGTAEPVQWFSGLTLLREMCRQSPPLVPAFFTLFVAGAILALAYQRSGALFFSIGLHAGWVFWLKSYRLFFQPSGLAQAFWGSDNLIDGWVSLLVLLAVLGLVAMRRGGESA